MVKIFMLRGHLTGGRFNAVPGDPVALDGCARKVVEQGIGLKRRQSSLHIACFDIRGEPEKSQPSPG